MPSFQAECITRKIEINVDKNPVFIFYFQYLGHVLIHIKIQKRYVTRCSIRDFGGPGSESGMTKYTITCDHCGAQMNISSGAIVEFRPNDWNIKKSKYDLCHTCAETVLPAIVRILEPSPDPES